MKKSLLSTVLTLAAVVVSFAHSGSAEAQVQFEGTAKYKLKQTGSLVSATASVTRVANYTYSSISNAVVRLVLSSKPHKLGSDVVGTTVARSSTLAILEARTFYNNVTLSGSANCNSGKKRAILLLTDGTAAIRASYNFTRAVSLRKVKRIAKRALSLRAAESNAHFIEE